jgi:hypothetical protein
MLLGASVYDCVDDEAYAAAAAVASMEHLVERASLSKLCKITTRNDER